jgi:hypothetical protein
VTGTDECGTAHVRGRGGKGCIPGTNVTYLGRASRLVKSTTGVDFVGPCPLRRVHSIVVMKRHSDRVF